MKQPAPPRVCCECRKPITGYFERYSQKPGDTRIVCAACVRLTCIRALQAIAQSERNRT